MAQRLFVIHKITCRAAKTDQICLEIFTFLMFAFWLFFYAHFCMEEIDNRFNYVTCLSLVERLMLSGRESFRAVVGVLSLSAGECCRCFCTAVDIYIFVG